MVNFRCPHVVRLLGILETNFSGRNTRKDLSIRKSKSTFASAKMVIDLCARTFNNKEKFIYSGVTSHPTEYGYEYD